MFFIIKSFFVWLIAERLYHQYQLIFSKLKLENKEFQFNFKKYLLYMVYVVILMISVICYWPAALMLIILLPILKKTFLTIHKKKQQRMIQYYGYKIFKFIINQISSGILVSDAIQSMYLVVDDAPLRKKLLDVSAYYAQTSELDQALTILKTSYSGIEVDILCVAIEQGIHTGANYEMLIKMEALLFKKYIYQIKFDTEMRKKRGVLAVLLLCTVIVLMITIPIVIDIINAFNQIFF